MNRGPGQISIMGSKQRADARLAKDAEDFSRWRCTLGWTAWRDIDILHRDSFPAALLKSIQVPDERCGSNIIYLPQVLAQRTCNGYMNPVIRGTSLLLAGCIMFLAGCVEKPDPSIEARYQATADRFCNAIVECLKEDMAQKMKDQPQKRDLFLQRMDRDLCLSGQYQKIAGLQELMDEGTILDRYTRCSDTLEASEDCIARLDALKSNPDCKSIRTAQEFP